MRSGSATWDSRTHNEENTAAAGDAPVRADERWMLDLSDEERIQLGIQMSMEQSASVPENF